MSYVGAEVYLNGVDELELYVKFSKKLEALRIAKCPQGSWILGGCLTPHGEALSKESAHIQIKQS